MKQLFSYIIASILHHCDIYDAAYCVLIVFFSENPTLAHVCIGLGVGRAEGNRKYPLLKGLGGRGGSEGGTYILRVPNG